MNEFDSAWVNELLQHRFPVSLYWLFPAWSLEDYQCRGTSPVRGMSGVNVLCADVFQCYTIKGEAMYYTLLQLWASALLPTRLNINCRVIKSLLWRYAQDPSWKYAWKSVSHQHEIIPPVARIPDFRFLKLTTLYFWALFPTFHSVGQVPCGLFAESRRVMRKQEQDSTAWAFKNLPLEFTE